VGLAFLPAVAAQCDPYERAEKTSNTHWGWVIRHAFFSVPVQQWIYNVAVTSWLAATLDLQIIEPALARRTNSSTGQLEHVGTTVMPGVRLYVRL